MLVSSVLGASPPTSLPGAARSGGGGGRSNGPPSTASRCSRGGGSGRLWGETSGSAGSSIFAASAESTGGRAWSPALPWCGESDSGTLRNDDREREKGGIGGGGGGGAGKGVLAA